MIFIKIMTVLQIPLSKEMQKGLNDRTNPVGISSTAYVKILIAKDLGFLIENNNFQQGNIFNADRDNDGKGIEADEFLTMLEA